MEPAAVVILLAFMFFQAVLSMRLKSFTFDETAHLPAGYSYLKTHDYRINLEQPPLIKLLAGIPILFMNPNLPLYTSYWQEGSQYQFGKYFLYYSGNDADRMIFWGRMPIVLLGLLAGFYVYLWAKALYGVNAGILASFFYVFCPNMLAHSRLVTMDFGLGCFMLMACYHFWKYLEKPDVKGLLLSGFFTGLALVTKFSAVMLLPVFAVLGFYRTVFHEKAAGKNRLKIYKEKNPTGALLRLACAFGIIALISIIIIFACYSFRADALALYKKGMGMIYWNQSQDYKFYLGGKFSVKPWWYYYLYAFFIKTTIPALIAIAAAIAVTGSKKLYEEAWLLLPVFLVLLVSFFDSRNLGLRRILPVYPFLYVFAGKIAGYPGGLPGIGKKAWTAASVILAGWHLFSCAGIYPDYLTYFNGFAGGPSKGIYHLDDSNIDWGQDLKRLKTYMDKNKIENIKLLYYGTSDENYYGIKTMPVTGDEEVNGPKPGSGWFAISAHYLVRLKLGVIERGYGVDWLDAYKPVGVIGNTIYVYRF